MIKKTVIGLHLVLATVLSLHLFSLWQGLHLKPILEEKMNMTGSHIATSFFKPSARTSYPSLFDVQIPSPINDKVSHKKNKQTGDASKQAPKEMLETPEGMRLRAVFTSQDQRVALVEPQKKKNGPLVEVKEADMVQGYLVQAVASGYINLLRQKDQETFKLVIFDLNQNKPNQAK